jgi:hypothetical protein
MEFGFEESDLAGDYYFDTRDFEEGDVYEVGLQDADLARTGSGLLFVQNTDVRVNPWLRAAKLRNLPIEEQTSYRFTYWIKGSNTYDIGAGEENCQINTSPMQGVDFTDTDIFGADNARYGRNESGFDPENWTKKTVMFYYETVEMYQEYWDGARPDWGGEVLPEEYFFLFNFFTPGTFHVDDIELWESTIGGIYFNANTVVVDFGYEIDIASLGLNEGNPTLDFPKDALSVSVNGANANISYASLQNDARLYIALTQQLDPADNVEVDFYNPIGDPDKILLYSSNLRPEAFDPNSNGEVLNFYAEPGEHDETIEESEVDEDETSVNGITQNTVRVWANNGLLHIASQNNETVKVEVLTLTGASVMEKTVRGKSALDVRGLKGIFLVRTIDNSNNQVKVSKLHF